MIYREAFIFFGKVCMVLCFSAYFSGVMIMFGEQKRGVLFPELVFLRVGEQNAGFLFPELLLGTRFRIKRKTWQKEARNDVFDKFLSKKKQKIQQTI